MYVPGSRYFSVLMMICLFVTTFTVMAAPDYEREKRWADEILPGVIVGDPVYLVQANQHRFLGLLAEAEKARMGVVVVHGMGLHPDWGMISTIRQELFDEGYTTFSIQMPILAADASYKAYPPLFQEAAERLQLAVGYLKQKGYRHVAIVSHSNGSRMSRVYMASRPHVVDAWVALSLTQGDTFEGVSKPVLDLYGEYDLPHVLSSVSKRKKTLNGNAGSVQKMIVDADHFFYGQEDVMIQAVREFLDGIR